ncbi:MAG TPA: hypothetical protein DDZ89_12340 [Clostridiales bacterium]|nr:hypothetical protein [Clostridiales bacterium]
MESNVQKIIDLIDTLTPEDKKLIYKKLNDEINSELLDFLDSVNERAIKYSISLEEITKEVEEVRSNNHGKL